MAFIWKTVKKKRIKIWNVEFYIKLENVALACLSWLSDQIPKAEGLLSH